MAIATKKMVNGAVVDLTTREKNDIEAEWSAWDSGEAIRESQRSAEQRNGAVTLTTDPGPPYKMLRSVLIALTDEINLLRQRDAAWKTAVASAKSLDELKTSVAALPDLTDRTVAQAKTAVVNKINSGDAD